MSKDLEVTTHHFKTHISALIRELEAGHYDRIVVKKNKYPVGVFTLPEKKPVRRLGFLKDKIRMDEDDWKRWDALDAEIVKDFEDSIDRENPA